MGITLSFSLLISPTPPVRLLLLLQGMMICQECGGNVNIPGALLENICQLDKSLHVKYFLNSKNEMDLCMNVKRETQKL